jgi:hypothetical protein
LEVQVNILLDSLASVRVWNLWDFCNLRIASHYVQHANKTIHRAVFFNALVRESEDSLKAFTIFVERWQFNRRSKMYLDIRYVCC